MKKTVLDPCDLILTDLQISEMDGVELTRTLCEREKVAIGRQ